MTIYLSGVDHPLARKIAETRDNIGLLVTPATSSYVPHLPNYEWFGVDNGCFSKGGDFDLDEFIELLDRIAAEHPGMLSKCLFAVAPDVFDPVAMKGDPLATWERSAPVFDKIRAAGFPAALVYHDGLEDMIDSIDWDAFDVAFIGGSTEFKLGYPGEHGGMVEDGLLFPPDEDERIGTARAFNWFRLMYETHRRGKPIHVGRVNSWKRMLFCDCWGARSADGTYLKFGPTENAPKLESWLSRVSELAA